MFGVVAKKSRNGNMELTIKCSRRFGGFMGILDDQSLIQKYDKEGMLQKIQEFPSQVEIAWNQVQSFIVPTHYIKAKNVVICGMGGSAIGGDLIKDLTFDTSRISVTVVRDYNLPAFVESNTLVIISTYSGNTEETLSVFKQAVELGAKVIVISTGGKAASLCRKYKIPMFEIKYESPPRAAFAYSFIPLLGIFNKLGYIELEKEEILNAVKYLIDYKQKIDMNITTSSNDAKKIAEKLYEKLPVIMAGGILTNIARRFKDQLNENSKTMACLDVIPELCHNHIVGLDYPKEVLKETYTIILQSKFDHPRNKLRHQILLQILQRKGIKYESVFINQKGGRVSEMLHNVLFVDYVSYYLAMLNNVDPTTIDSINFLKDKLAENK